MIHVLIIEDEPAIARVLSLLITKNYPDFQISGICKNGRDGLQKILELKPELVFTDITMPVMNGLDATKIIREENKEIPIIMQTAYAFSSDKENAMNAGASEVLVKPITLSILRGTLTKYFPELVW